MVDDESYRKQLGEEGHLEAVEKYQIDQKVAQLEQIIESIVKERKNG